MKKILGASSFLTFLLLMLQAGVTSCSKEPVLFDTVTVTKRDTVYIKDTAVSLQLLTANAWKLQEIRGVQGNTIIYYNRGGTGNTENFDREYIQFRANNTGTYIDGDGASHGMTWSYSNAEETKITLVIQNPAPTPSHTMVYDNLRYKNGALLFDQYWSYNNVNFHAQVVRTPLQ